MNKTSFCLVSLSLAAACGGSTTSSTGTDGGNPDGSYASSSGGGASSGGSGQEGGTSAEGGAGCNCGAETCCISAGAGGTAKYTGAVGTTGVPDRLAVGGLHELHELRQRTDVLRGRWPGRGRAADPVHGHVPHGIARRLLRQLRLHGGADLPGCAGRSPRPRDVSESAVVYRHRQLHDGPAVLRRLRRSRQHVRDIVSVRHRADLLVADRLRDVEPMLRRRCRRGAARQPA